MTNELTVSNTAWHYRLFKWEMKQWGKAEREPTNLCPYFWTLFAGVPVTVFVKGVMGFALGIVSAVRFVFGSKAADATWNGMTKIVPPIAWVFQRIWIGLRYLGIGLWFVLTPIWWPIVKIIEGAIWVVEFIIDHGDIFVWIPVTLVVGGIGVGLYFAVDGTASAIGWWTPVAWVAGPAVIIILLSSGVYATQHMPDIPTPPTPSPPRRKPKPAKPKGTPFHKLMWAYVHGKKKKFCPAIKVVQ